MIVGGQFPLSSRLSRNRDGTRVSVQGQHGGGDEYLDPGDNAANRAEASAELADEGRGGLAVERQLTDGDEPVVFKYLARGRIAQRDPRAQPGESVLCGGELAHLTHRRCG